MTLATNDPLFKTFVRVNNDASKPTKTETANTYNHPIECIDFSSKSNLLASLGIKSDIGDDKVDLLEGCGLAVFNANYGYDDFDNSEAFKQPSGDFPISNKTALFCASCKPGYKAEYFDNHENIVRNCSKIDNCSDAGYAMNACETCTDGYLHEYSQKILWDSCVKIPSNNLGLKGCLAYKPQTSGSLEGTCKVCKKGYFMNKDNYCE